MEYAIANLDLVELLVKKMTALIHARIMEFVKETINVNAF
jgi:hypothetical protein